MKKYFLFTLIIYPSFLFAQISFTIKDTIVYYYLHKENTKGVNIELANNYVVKSYRLLNFRQIIGVTSGDPNLEINNTIDGLFFCLFDSSQRYMFGSFLYDDNNRLNINKRKNKIVIEKQAKIYKVSSFQYLDLQNTLIIKLYPFFWCYPALTKGRYYLRFIYNFNGNGLDFQSPSFNNTDILIFNGHLETNLVKLIVR